MPTDSATWLGAAHLAVSVIGVLITVWIALVVQRSTSKITQLEFMRALRESWVHIDDMTLRDASLLRLANAFLPQRLGADQSFGQKRIFLLAYLSPLNTAYQAARQGLYGSGSAAAIEAIKSQIRLVVADEDGYWVTQNHGHDPEFMQLCREVRQTVASTAA